jgi:hypothetical protein
MSRHLKKPEDAYGERKRCPQCGAPSSAPEAATGPRCWLCHAATDGSGGEDSPRAPQEGFLGWGCFVPYAVVIGLIALPALFAPDQARAPLMRLAGVAMVAAALGIPLLILIGFAKSSEATWSVLFPVGILALVPMPGLLVAVLVVAGIVALVSGKPEREATDVRKQSTPFARSLYYGVAVSALVGISLLSAVGVFCGVLCMTYRR